MKVVFHILWKDIRHLRGLLVLWFAVILLELTLGGASRPEWMGRLAIERSLSLVSQVVTFAQMLLAVVIVPLLIQEEDLVGNRAFWLTRPISRGHLIAAKSLFVVLFLLLPSLLSEIVVMAANQVPARALLAAVPQIFLEQGAFVMGIAAIAVLTSNFSRFVVLGAILVVTWIMALSLFLAIMGMGRTALPTRSPFAAQQIVFWIAAIGGSVGIVANQYLGRKRMLSLTLLVLLMPLLLAARTLWPWNFLGTPPPRLPGVGFARSDVEVLFDPSYGWPQPDHSGFLESSEPVYLIERKLKLASRLPEYVVEPLTISSSLVFKGGVRADYSGPFRPYIDIWGSKAFEHALGGLQILNPRNSISFGNLQQPVLRVAKSLYETRGKETGDFSARILVRTSRFQVVGEAPLRSGAEMRSGSERLRIGGVSKGTYSCEFQTYQCTPRLLFLPTAASDALIEEGHADRREFVLRNTTRREAFLASGKNCLLAFCHKGRLEVRLEQISFRSSNKENWMSRIDEEWLKQVDVAWVECLTVARFYQEVEDREFQLFPDQKKFLQHGVAQDRLSQIQLPEKPTKQQVKAYIDAILAASEGQTKFSRKDPQIEMLKKIGPENVDALLPYVDSPSQCYFPIWALMSLLGPEHRQMVAQGLPHHRAWVLLIRDKGWQEDVRELLIRELKNCLATNSPASPAHEHGWIHCVAMLKDPATYDDLRQYFTRGPNRHYTYEAVKDLPDFPLADAVAEAWKAAKNDNSFEAIGMMRIACERGEKDALDFAFNMLRKSSPNSWEVADLLKNLPRYTEAVGDRDALLKWYEENREKLVFDPVQRKFVFPKTALSPSPPAAP